ncbi:alpha/beta hydrolase [Campylobacter sp. MIT 99-7217]|uniref:alpha/beta fold hydrolase n=1 Tax=Campylobacter sp. MIT 99-7217 TaxID=535091 RepID=UPI00115BD6A1|nr:alpha/beta hydrolase [Campylobacter sp. MIT 99-7217]TQR34462.1 alpha/beta hydrolase [Campylobacter sp. MIT 99-7217]
MNFVKFMLFLAIFSLANAGEARYFMQQDSDITSKIPYGNNEKAGSYVDVGDTKLYYELYGKGEVVLVLHGGGVGSTYEMGRLIDELSKNYQVIALSTRAHGKSPIGKEPLSYEQKAKDALAVLKKVSKKPAIVLGFSDGAYTAYKLASMYPKSVKKIIAIGAGELISPNLRKIPPVKLETWAKMDAKFMKNKLELSPESPDDLQKYFDEYFKFYSELKVSKELFSTIKCPVLLIVGENDANAPLDSVLAAHKMIPNASLAVIANAPHPAFNANFDAVWANIKPFLQR